MAYIEAFTDSPSHTTLRPLGHEDILFEYMLNVLRLPQGFTTAAFQERTGLESEALHDRLEVCREKGLLQQIGEESWRPTDLGLRFLNDLQEQFLPLQAPA